MAATTTDLIGNMRKAAGVVKSIFPSTLEIVAEPGKYLVQPLASTISRVLSINRHPHGSDTAVVDACVSDLPDLTEFGREIDWWPRDGSGWRPLNEGADMILGRICMEHDIVRQSVLLPPDLREGDFLRVRGTGAYDMSMRYDFGC